MNGDLYLTRGDTSSWFGNDRGATIVRSLDGGVSWTTIAGINEALIAFGKAPSGDSYPTMYMIGWYGGTYGLFRSYDKGDTIEALTTYTHFDQPWALAADPTRFGRVVVGFSRPAWRERTYNYTMRLS